MAPALLTAVDSTDHVHLIIGTNPLAGARCSKSFEVGAKVKLIAPTEAELHYGLQKRVDEGQVEWLKKDFEDDDVKTVGREEVDGFVDAVFVTLGGKHPLSTIPRLSSGRGLRELKEATTDSTQVRTFLPFAAASVSKSMLPTPPPFAPSLFSARTQMGPFRSAPQPPARAANLHRASSVRLYPPFLQA